ncbi:hypothetical protein V6N12_004223 [Hibiscus sabdariffa]|uniref:Glycosyltransferase n=1 Tax=Hibiscus sabdariffa TaxID=183260 RepID=A0ABR2CKU7_9ROSI
MGSILMATTSIMLCAGLAAVISSTYSVKKPLNNSVFGAHDEFMVAIKYVTVLSVFLFSFLCHTSSIRFISQASILINTPQDPAFVVGPDYVSKLLEKGYLLNTVGYRLFYAALPLLLWIFGPVLVFMCSIVVVTLLYNLDFVFGFGRKNKTMQEIAIATAGAGAGAGSGSGSGSLCIPQLIHSFISSHYPAFSTNPLPKFKMKATHVWHLQLNVKDIIVMSGSRKRPVWIILLVNFVILFLIVAYVYSPTTSAACFIFSSKDCTLIFHKQPPALKVPARELTDGETISQVVISEILRTPPVESNNPKIAFLFLTPGTLPFEALWAKFFQGHEGRFSVYVHASREKPVHKTRYFKGRDIHSESVVWGQISMVDAERRLLAQALLDPDNQQFVLLSESCIPLQNFDYVYNYLMLTNVSFIDCFVDLGPHGSGRYSEHMMPEVEKKDFRKGSQWFALKRQHAIITMADSLYYTKFKYYCKPNMEGRNCYADEHYLPTFFNMIDPGGIANRSVTYVDWSERRWHPKSFKPVDITLEFLKNLTSIDDFIHFTSDSKRVLTGPCTWNGIKRPCYLFARKFYPETLEKLTLLFSNYTTLSV